VAINLIWGNLTIPGAGALNGVAAGAAARQIAAAGSRSAVPLVYGEDRIGALILNVLPAAAGSTTLLVQCLWGFAGDSVNDLQLNDLALPAGSTQTHYTGSQASADAALVAAFAAQGITYTDTLAGFMYSVVGIPIRAFDGRLDLRARIRGRKLYDPRRNRFANIAFNGAVAGSPGVEPTDINLSNSGALGLTRTIVGIGREEDIPYIDVRWNGTASAGGSIAFNVGTSSASMPASPGQSIQASGHIKLQAGSMSGTAGVVGLSVQARDAAFALLSTLDSNNIAPGTGPLSTCRRTTTAATTPASTAALLVVCGTMTITNGAAIDVTLRIGLPMAYTAGADPLAWSDNPSLAEANFLTSASYGLNRPVDWASVGPAADANDAMIGSPAEKRRTLGLSFIQPANAADIAEALRAYAGCFLLPSSGAGIALLPDADAAPAASYDHAAGEICALEDLTQADLGNMPTAVEVVYTDTSAIPWRDNSVTAALAGAGTTLPWRLSQVRLPGIQRYSQANREAIERLNKLTLSNLSCALEVFDIGIRHQVGDIVEVTHPVGLTAKLMRVAGAPQMPGHGRWRLPLAEHDPAAYSTAVATGPTYTDAGFLNPAGPPGTVTGFAAATAVEGVLLSWTANPEPDVTGYELRVGGTNWATASPLVGAVPTIVSGTTYAWLPAAGTYTLRICARDSEGLLSTTPATVSGTVTAAPGSVATWATITGTGKPADNATKNTVTYSSSAPVSPTNGDIWVDTSVTPNVSKYRISGAWQIGANYSTNTNQLTDGANLGGTAVWTGVSGTGKPADNSTRNVTYRQSGDPVSSPGGVVDGDTWLQIDGGGLTIATKYRVSGAWVLSAAAPPAVGPVAGFYNDALASVTVGTAYARIRFNTDGTTSISTDTGTPSWSAGANWYSPTTTGIGSSYKLSGTYVGDAPSGLPSGAGTVLSSAISVLVSKGSPVGQKESTVIFSIRDASTNAEVASGTGYLFASYEI